MSAALSTEDPAVLDTTSILAALLSALDDMPPQVRRAAQHLLDNSSEIAVTSMRSMASAAGVKPNTLVRMARHIGLDGYEALRDPFRAEAAEAAPSFPDRARWLQSISEGGRHGALLADMAAATLHNAEALFESIDLTDLRGAADLIDRAAKVNVLGVGTAKPLADNFTYVARMCLDNIAAIPTVGVAIDDVARMTADDALVAITFRPYRAEIVEAVRMAAQRSVPVVAVTDSLGSPIVRRATHFFVVPTYSPYPFSSIVAATALLETLLAYMIADAPTDAAAAIDAFHENRHRSGIYTQE